MRLNSIRLAHNKRASEIETTELALPESVVISMSQHGGVPCKPLVSVGDKVETGTLIADSDAYMSVPIHSSVTGTVTGFTKILNVFGKSHDAVVIETSPLQIQSSDIKPPVVKSRQDFIDEIRRSGLVGLGGAGFPTHIKLDYAKNNIEIDTLVVNGAECEPFITSDYRAFMENGDRVADGIRLTMEYLGIKRAVIGIEDNKMPAIEKMRELTADDDNITVMTLPSDYPQGAEKILIYNTTGRVVGSGELPSSAGCLVMNCSTAAFIAKHIRTGYPLLRRRMTIDGGAVAEPVNVYVPVGTRASDIIKYIKLRSEPDRAVYGGPMMGTTFYDMGMPVTKTCNALLLFSDTKKYDPSPCIRCGRCVRACPVGLLPTELEHAYDKKDAVRLKKLNVGLCMNCGSCSYVCPAKRNLSEKNQLAKLFLRKQSS